MDLIDKIILALLKKIDINVNFDINFNGDFIKIDIKTIFKRCLMIIIIIIICYALSISSEPSITITEESSVTLTEEPSITIN